MGIPQNIACLFITIWRFTYHNRSLFAHLLKELLPFITLYFILKTWNFYILHDNRMIFLTGPFTSNEMAEWFSAGYFTMNLQVKRGCDEKISPLGLYLLFIRLSWKNTVADMFLYYYDTSGLDTFSKNRVAWCSKNFRL